MSEYFIKFLVFSSGLNFSLYIENSLRNLRNLLKEVKDMEVIDILKTNHKPKKNLFYLIPITISNGIYNSLNNIIFSSHSKTPYFNFNNKDKSIIINSPKCSIINPHKFLPEKLSPLFSFMVNGYYNLYEKLKKSLKVFKSNILFEPRNSYDFFLPGDSVIALVKGENIIPYENENYVLSPLTLINGNKYVFTNYIKNIIFNTEILRYFITFPLISFSFCCIWKEINRKFSTKIKIVKINNNRLDLCKKCKKFKSQVIFKGCNHCVLCYLCFVNYHRYCPICKIPNPDYIILID